MGSCLNQVLKYVTWRTEWRKILETEGEVVSCSFYLDALTYCMPAFLRLGADTVAGPFCSLHVEVY